MAQSATKTKTSPATSPTGRRGRPTADRAQSIDANIRSAALKIFLEAGFEAASMDAIAAQAPVSKATLYARYDSKQALFRAVMEDELERLSKAAGARDHLLPPELAARLRHHARTLLDIFDWPQFRALGQLIDSAVRTFPELERDWQELGAGRYVRFLTNDIAQAIDAGRQSTEECEFLANLFLHSITGWYRSEAGRRSLSRDEVLAFADRVIDTIMMRIGRQTAAADTANSR